MSGFKHVVLDFGNVLVRVDFERCFKVWAEKTGVSVERIKSKFVFDQAYARHERGEISAQDYGRHVSQTLELPLSYEDFAAGWNAVFGEVIEETRRFIETNGDRFRFSVLSNTNLIHHKIWSELYSKDLARFERIYCSHEMGCRKPDSSAFEWILRDLRLKPEQVVFVDDLLENVRGAEALGIRAIHCKDPRSGIAELQRLLT